MSQLVRSAEQSGGIRRMTESVIDLAFSEWQKFGHTSIALSINLSLNNLTEPDLAKRISRALKKHHFDARFLWFEIDEKAQELASGLWLAIGCASSPPSASVSASIASVRTSSRNRPSGT
jgi:EAL domain-containing protein (putative c-di-GMP-specific phosphodiesterase class I)